MTQGPLYIPIKPLRWLAQDLAPLAEGGYAAAPVIAAADVRRIGEKLDVWDAWPLADTQGMPVPWRGGELWFALTAPAYDDPEERHGLARIHHFHHIDGRFVHLGRTFPPGFTPGSREWSGTATLREGIVTLYFTASGKRGERKLTFNQRLFASTTKLLDGDGEAFAEWSIPVEQAIPHDVFYLSEHEAGGRPGEIKAFRDPAAYWAADGREYLLFTASSARSRGLYNGVIGCSVHHPDGQHYNIPPLVDASQVNNELERPHIVEHGGKLYLFWSTQAAVFAPGVVAPTGLYGAVANDLTSPWSLLNGTGLVFANPPQERFQAYSWWVTPDLRVASFVDYWGIGDPDARVKPAGRSHFGGTFAPFLRLHLDGEAATLV